MKFIKRIRKLLANGPRDALKRIIRKLLLGKGILFFERFGFHILPVHYYSPVSSMRNLQKNVKQWYKQGSFTGIDFDIEGQLKLLGNLAAYKRECEGLNVYEKILEQCFGEGYGEVESHILHTMIRYLKPQRIIEIGSGVSTFFSANALSLNKIKDSVDSKLICIEPYPWPKLRDIQRDCELEIFAKPVQEIDVDFFKKLGEGDILFIDSSHIVKIGSDVNYLYLEVLPNLNKGVVVHIHDIFFPYPTFNSTLLMFGEYRFWTESALVQALLTYSTAFKILLCSSYLHYKQPEALQSAFKIYNPEKHLPSSLWIQK